jgi:hypothetical protein
MMMQRIALNAFKRLGENANLTPEESARYFDIGARLEMRSRGEPEDLEVASVIVNINHRAPEPEPPEDLRPKGR